MSHEEHNRVHRVGWLRAAVMGANDGIVAGQAVVDEDGLVGRVDLVSAYDEHCA